MRHRRRPRISVRLPTRGSALLAAAALVAGALTTPAIAAPVTPVASSTATDPAGPATADGVALSQAVSSGRSVVVDSATTETSQLVARPDGTLQLTSSMQPVRAHPAAGWVPLDTRLTQAADGTLVPAASPTNVAFSGGGAGPLVTMTDPTGAAISMSWPAPLPAPTITGSAATYASVLPGVDLTLTAIADSYSEVLIVKNAAAAANPALTQLRMNVTASGVTLINSDGGGLAAVDAAGATVFRAAQPTMWDSGKHQSLGATPTATDAGGGTLTPLKTTIASTTAAATCPTAAAASTVTLYPPIAALTGPGVTYPLFIDPGFTRNRAHWATFFNNGWKYFDLATEQLRVGFCDDNHLAGCNGIGVGRTMFSFDTSALAGVS